MLTMIVVDDEEIIREGLRDFVDWAGMGIKIIGVAENGKEALQKVREMNPDIVLTDVVMPVMDGLDFIKTMREEGQTATIVVLSAFQDFNYIKSALKYDAVDYLVKPFNQEELERVMDKVIMHVKRDMVIAEHFSKNDFSKQVVTREGKIAQEVIKLIEDRYHEKVTIQDMADEVCLSVNHMAAIFKRETGETVVDYLTKVRVKQAKKLLRDPSVKIYTIAESTGYPDANYFAKVFKKHTGLSPKEYRDLHP